MSKAEKFIQDYTRNCSNLAHFEDAKGNVWEENTPWLTPDQARRAVEIARKEMIEKFCSLLNKMIWEITYEDLNGNSVCNYDKVKFINDLKQAMKDE